MRSKTLSVFKLSGLLAVLVGFVVLAGCGGGSGSSTTTTTSTGTPAVTLSTTSITTFSSAVGVASAPQSVTVTNSGTGALTITGIIPSTSYSQTNNCPSSLSASSACTISVIFTPTATGTITGTLSISDSATGSPQVVTLSGTGSSASATPASLTFADITVGTTSAAQTVTLKNGGSSALTVTSVSTAAPFTVSSNTCGTSVAANSSCTIGVTFSPTVSGTSTGTLTIIDASGTQTVSLTGSNTFLDQAQVTVSFGVNGYLGAPTTTSGSYYNGIFTTVTVCQPGTTTCVNVPNVLVDTGSVGLRVLSTALTGVTLSQINDTSTGTSYPLYECVQYGDLSYTWGPMQMATVEVGGETASTTPGGTANVGIPIQVISSTTPPNEIGVVSSSFPSSSGYLNPCLYYSGSNTATGGLNDGTAATLGANGILGVGNFPQDCSFGGVNYCTSISTTTGQYLMCTNSTTCYVDAVAVQNQAWNPVATFATDNNGVSIFLPPIPAAGQATATGILTFGIGTESNNALNGATIYGLDSDGNFESATLNGVGQTYTSANSGGTFIDSGSNALYVSDAATLGTSDCYFGDITYQDDIGYYCPSPSPLAITLGLTGSNSTSTTVPLSIGSALSMFSANTSFAAFNDLGGPSCIPDAAEGIVCGVSEDYFDLGLPFFFGQPHGVFVGITGTSLSGTTYTNGFWAF